MTSSTKVVSVTQLVAHLRSPLYRNGYALLLSAAATSVLGIVYWVLAARYYSPDNVGLNSAILNVMMLTAGASQLSLNGALSRFIPVAGRAVKRFVIYAYLITVVVAAFVSLIVALSLQTWSAALHLLNTNWGLLGLFVLSTIAWCLFTLQDSVLVGLRQTMWVPIENIIFAVGKIVLLIGLATLFAEYGILVSWMLPVVALLLPVNFLIFKYLIPQHLATPDGQAPPIQRRQITTFISGNYPGTLFSMATAGLLPVIVTRIAGPAANAYFYIPWMVAASLQMISITLTTSFTVEAARDQANLGTYCYQAVKQIARLLVPSVVVFVAGAPFILRIFGEQYATEGAMLLRLLVLATIPHVVVMLYLSLARIYNMVTGIILTQGAICVATLALSYVWLQSYGIIGVGVAWLMSQTCMALVLLVTQIRPLLRRGGVGPEAKM